MRGGIAVVRQLELEVHRRAEQQVGRRRAGIDLRDEAVVELRRIQIDIGDLDGRMEHLKVGDGGAQGIEVGRAVDEQLAVAGRQPGKNRRLGRSEEHTYELQSIMRNSYAVFCVQKKQNRKPERSKKN